MSRLILPPVSWTRQPQTPTGVDVGNPITSGIVWALNSADRTINGVLPATDTSSRGFGASGKGQDHSGTSLTAYDNQPAFSNGMIRSSGLTVAVLFDLDAATNYGALVTHQGSATANIPIELRLGANSTQTNVHVTRAHATGNRQFITGTNWYAAGDTSQLVVVTFADNLLETVPNVWMKRQKTLMTFNTGSGTGAITSSSSAQLRFGRRLDGVTQLDGRIYAAFAWSRPLADSEVLSLFNNPWQVFKPQERFIFLPTAGGGGTTINCTLGTATASGFQAAVSQATNIACSLGTATASGFQATVSTGTAIAGQIGTATAQGFQAAVSVATEIACALGTASASGFQANVNVGSGTTINCALGTATASGFQAGVAQASAITCATGTATASGYQAAVSSGGDIACQTGTATASGFRASIAQAIVIPCAVGTASGIGYQAVVGAGTLQTNPRYTVIATARRRSVIAAARNRTVTAPAYTIN